LAILRQRRHWMALEDTSHGLFTPSLAGLTFDFSLIEEITS